MRKQIVLLVIMFFVMASIVEAKTVRVVYKPDKSVAIIHPAPKSQRIGETEEAWLKRVFSKSMVGELEGLPYDDVDFSELPQSREYRNAWEGEKGKKITVNQQKAQDMAQEKQQKAQDKINARNKLKSLGLTDDEVKALFN